MQVKVLLLILVLRINQYEGVFEKQISFFSIWPLKAEENQ